MPEQSKPDSSTTPGGDQTVEDGRSFFKRWSERKSGVDADTQAITASDEGLKVTDDEGLATEPTTDAAPILTEADLENLDCDSDFSKFMGEQVPEALRRQALRQLWRSDPVLANVDGLCDYDDDYTDAALAVKVLKTAHRVGQGYLTDEEVAANKARGEPKTNPDQADNLDEMPETQSNVDEGEAMDSDQSQPETAASSESDQPEDHDPVSTDNASGADQTEASNKATS